MDLLDRLNRITQQLAELSRMPSAELLATTQPGQLPALARECDWIIQTAAHIRATVDNCAVDRETSDTRRDKFIRRIRKALGYSYP